MVYYGERIRSNPIIISGDKEPKFLHRIPPSKKLFNESWLQELIFSYPRILPVGEIESIFNPLISIGREIPTEVGSIDNLFISPQGYLTIVETKLWRNPEARREVVGQIIDYAKEVSKWSYEDLNQKVKNYSKASINKDLGIVDLIKKSCDLDEEQEIELIDAITKNIKQGHFLLLIVGDGIRESVEDMAEYLSQYPQLHFTLALVELKIYEMGKDRLVIPQLVVRTQEVTRAIIRVEGQNIENLFIDMDLNTEENEDRKRRYTLSEEKFFEELRENVSEEAISFAKKLMEGARELGCEIVWRQSSFVIRYPDPLGSSQLLTLLVINRYAEVYTGWLIGQLQKIHLPIEVGVEFHNQIDELLNDYEIKPDYYSLEKIKGEYDNIIKAIEQFIEGIEAVD